MPRDLTVRGPRKRLWAYLRKDGKIKRAYHQRGDMRGFQSCSHCAQGQVRPVVGQACSVCKAEVVEVSEGGDVRQGRLEL